MPTNKSDLQIQTNTDFCVTVQERFQTYCKSKGLTANLENFIHYLVRCNIVHEIEINRFMVLHHYPEKLHKNDGVKLRAIYDIEDLVPLQERSIWTIINKMQRRFRPDPSPKFTTDLEDCRQ